MTSLPHSAIFLASDLARAACFPLLWQLLPASANWDHLLPSGPIQLDVLLVHWYLSNSFISPISTTSKNCCSGIYYLLHNIPIAFSQPSCLSDLSNYKGTLGMFITWPAWQWGGDWGHLFPFPIAPESMTIFRVCRGCKTWEALVSNPLSTLQLK